MQQDTTKTQYLKFSLFLFIAVFVFSHAGGGTSVAYASSCTVNSANMSTGHIITSFSGADYDYSSITTGTNTTLCDFNTDSTFTTGTIAGGGGDFYRAINGTSGGSGSSIGNNFGFTSGNYYLFIRYGNIGTGDFDVFGIHATSSTTGVPFTTSGVVLNTPSDTSTVSDFPFWNLTWNGSSGLVQVTVHYSENSTLLATCTTFPYGGGAGYSVCTNSTPRIYADYGIATTLSGGTVNVAKNTPLTLGKTYYAQAIIQTTDSMGTDIFVSPITSFTVGTPTPDILVSQECVGLDISCFLKNFATWAFIPTPESLTQFSTLSLQYKLPFSYGYDMVNVYNEMFPSSGSSLNFTIHTTMGNFTLLSSSVVASYSWYTLIYNAMSALMYLGTAVFLYKQVFGIHDQTHKTV